MLFRSHLGFCGKVDSAQKAIVTPKFLKSVAQKLLVNIHRVHLSCELPDSMMALTANRWDTGRCELREQKITVREGNQVPGNRTMA